MDDYKKQLIEEVKKFPSLWNVKHKAYRKNKIIKKIWSQIAEKFEKDGRDCQIHFKGLKDTYAKLLLDTKTNPNGIEAEKAKKWRYFYDMQFIDEVLLHSRTSLSSFVTSETNPANGCEDDDALHSIDAVYRGDQIHISSSYHLPSAKASESHKYPTRSTVLDKSANSAASSKRTNDHINDDVPSCSKQHHALNVVSGSDYSEEDIFGCSVAAQLKKLHPSLKVRAMIAIQQALFEQQQEQFQIIEVDPSDQSAAKY